MGWHEDIKQSLKLYVHELFLRTAFGSRLEKAIKIFTCDVLVSSRSILSVSMEVCR